MNNLFLSSGGLLQALFQSSLLGQCVVSGDGLVLASNPVFQSWFAFSEEGSERLPLCQLVHEKNRPLVLSALQAAHREELSQAPLELEHSRQDGSALWLKLHFQPMPGEIGTVLLQCEDITENRQIARAFEKQSVSLQRGFENMLCGLGVFAPNERYLRVNPTFCALLDYCEEELLGRSFRDIIHPDDLRLWLSVIERLNSGQLSSHQFELRFIKRGGAVIWVSLSIFPVRDEEEVITRFVSQCLDITEYKELEKSLLLEQENLRLAFNNAAIGMALVSPTEGHYLKVNPRLCEMVGYSEAELTRKRVTDITHPEDRDRDALILRQMADGSINHCSFEKRYIHRDGHVVWVNLFSAGAYDPERQLMYYVSQMLDITQKKRAEQALLASEESLRNAFENAAIGIAFFSIQGYFQEANQKTRQMLGYGIEELRSLTFVDLTHPDDRPRDDEVYRAMLAGTTTTCDYEKRFIHKNGNIVWVTLAGACLLDEHGRPTKFVAQIYDITEKKTVELAYQLSEQRFRSAFHSAAIGMAIAGPCGGLLKVNRALCTIVGYSELELLEMSFQAMTHPDDLGANLALWNSMKRREIETYQMEKRYIHRLGHEVWALVHVSGVFDAKDELVHQIAQIQDITERREAEIRLRKAKEQAEIAAQAKADFLSTMSHEIRTPLNAVLGMAYLLENTPLTEEQRDLVRTIQGGGNTLLSLINDILDLSKIESGKMEMEWQPVSLRVCIDEVMSLFHRKATEKGLVFNSYIDPTLAPEIRSDAIRIRQILINLTGNAIKFTNQGSVEIQVSGQPLTDDPDCDFEIIFSVKDTGCGIAPEKLDMIFEAFTQGDPSTTRHFGGTGLGLSISTRLAGLLGGAIEVESEPGKGSAFRFRLPIHTESLALQPVESEILSIAKNVPLMVDCPLEILVVDDNLVNRTIIARILSRFGYMPVLAESGQAALAILSEKRFDLIFMDVQMPDMDGLETTRLIRERLPDPPVVIALTAYAMEDERIRFLNSGMEDFISKPIIPTELKALLSHWYSRIEKKRQNSQGLIDPDNLLRRLSCDFDIIREMTGLFAQDVNRILAQLKIVIAEKNVSAIRELAHELRGACLTLSATHMQELAAQMETCLRQNQDFTECEQLLAQLREALPRTVDALRQIEEPVPEPL